MSSTTDTDEAATTDHDAATTARTEAEDKLWQALHANPNSTAADLSTDAGIGRSTAAKILARWANDGNVTRTPGIAGGGRRGADLWSITDPDAPSEAADTEHADTKPSGTRTQKADADETAAEGGLSSERCNWLLLSVHDALRAADRRPSKVISKALRAAFQRLDQRR